MSGSILRWAGLASLVMILAACVSKKPAAPGVPPVAPPAAETPVVCAKVVADHPMVGRWYSVSTPKGVGGQFQTLTVLVADGTMTYDTQLKIGRRIRPALRESGCWSYADGIYTMQTTKSYGEPVDTSDPIYRNQYRVEKIDGAGMRLRAAHGGQTVVARKMPAGFKLP